MPKEIPEANPPFSPEEQEIAANLSLADLQNIDATILANSCDHWQKVAWVIVLTERALKHRYPGLSYVFYAKRLCRLVDEGRLDSQGDVSYMRFSEVRLPIKERSSK